MINYLITNITIVNEGQKFLGHVWIKGERIIKVSQEHTLPKVPPGTHIIEGKNKILLPGIIDDQVHFRDPGFTYKGDLYSEAKAAVAGGITSFMEMPNTNPQTISNEILEEKFKIASEKSLANYSFYLGATNDNLNELRAVNRNRACGIKVFLGASTGNMLVDNPKTLAGIFAIPDIRIAVHCEDEDIIRKNLADYTKKHGENIPIEFHPLIRSEEACYASSSFAVALARKHNTNLHLIHVSTARELDLLDNTKHHNKRSD